MELAFCYLLERNRFPFTQLTFRHFLTLEKPKLLGTLLNVYYHIVPDLFFLRTSTSSALNKMTQKT